MWSGMGAIRRLKPEALWSTYPIATAHLIGSSLARRTRLPWVADFRDPMAQDDYPTDPTIRRSFEKIERKAIVNACFSTFTTPSAVREYKERYPQHAQRISLLENGYDEETFAGIEAGGAPNPGRITLLHSGIVYPSERDPTKLLEAIRRLREEQQGLYEKLVVRFRAPVHDELLNNLAQQYGVADAIEVLPPTGYRDALREMLCADGLLILQAANCNAQVPAKLYEYLRAGRPLLVLTDPAGDTAKVARDAGITEIAALDDANGIADLLSRFIQSPDNRALPSPDAVASASRRERTRQLAELLNRAVARDQAA